ncbi:hypothetical protein NHX12_009258 [Muraenolepis orangiensis]|uniref:Uncharacterized protein n=1 Tax=Muraenolepis orangiensis TaxID=630683 RepID=A0A9Q0I8U4_9TELE|nr:hypothetical protein NHX12_009258 [Muraenolepis orangiensis]
MGDVTLTDPLRDNGPGLVQTTAGKGHFQAGPISGADGAPTRAFVSRRTARPQRGLCCHKAPLTSIL